MRHSLDAMPTIQIPRPENLAKTANVRTEGRLAFLVPGDLATPTGGYRYDRRIIDELRRLGWHVDVLDIGAGFPFPSPEQRTRALKALSEVPDDRPVVVDGLALGTLPEAAALGTRKRLIALVHQALATDPSLESAQADNFRTSERIALSAAARVVVTSEATARIMISEYDVPPHRISVVLPGNDRVPQAGGSSDDVVRLLSVGSVVPGKGYDLLIAALVHIVDLPWHLTIAGDLSRDPAAAARLEADIDNSGFRNRVAVLGAVSSERVSELFMESDVFVLASRFESYGMALAEAIAYGVPIVSTKAGAIPDTVPEGAGILVPPDNVAGLAQALRRMIANPTERLQLATSARAAASRLPSWEDSARRFAAAIDTTFASNDMAARCQDH
jgi:glycosyltransferase involved in cell wall biosynthesis